MSLKSIHIHAYVLNCSIPQVLKDGSYLGFGAFVVVGQIADPLVLISHCDAEPCHLQGNINITPVTTQLKKINLEVIHLEKNGCPLTITKP